MIAALGFALSWLLQEVPLRGPARAESIGESFAMPHDATSLEELETIVSRLQQQDRRWEVYERIARQLDLGLAPDEMWLLVQVCRLGPLPITSLGAQFGVPLARLNSISDRLQKLDVIRSESGVLAATDGGRAVFDRMVEGHLAALERLAARWAPEQHTEAKAMLDRLARSLIAEIPIAPGRTASSTG